ncbi:MAG: phytoene/squalene synthase family protein [Bacteroidia bacterium]|nr:phytoene/squalene synthase family protein [Bacteroidia bacterium]
MSTHHLPMQLYKSTCMECSKLITQNYSTSFSLGIRTLAKKYHESIYAIYGFVRYADEIVDTFHNYDKAALLSQFREDTYQAIRTGISLNPVLHSFQAVVNEYNIEQELIDAFLHSMEMDLHDQNYNQDLYHEYIYGSAEVVGLMCLRVFLEGDEQEYQDLKEPARALGSAFQKVNFLRDMKSDYYDRGRVYFPGVDFNEFNASSKKIIEDDIQRDFDHALGGIMRLPSGARNGVYLAYKYYLKLFKKISKMPPAKILQERIRIPDPEKMVILFGTVVRQQFSFL